MTDILVRRCELRIRRMSGWAWGATADDLIKAATRAIPQLLAAKLPQLVVPDGETIAIDRPITVKIAATARQLAALGEATPGMPDVTALRARIEADVAAAVAQAIARDGVVAAPIAIAHVATHEQATEEAQETALASAEAPRRAARAWWRSGTIDAVLARLELGALVRLQALLLGDAVDVGESARELVAIAEQVATRYDAAPAPGLDRVRRRIALAAGVIEAAPAIAPARLRAVIDLFVPTENVATPPITVEGAADEAASAPAGVSRFTPTSSTGEPLRELEIRSALPFLMLASLHHAGWLDTAATLLALHEREADAFALAAGLAATVLDPLERGWSRSPADRLAIAAFAGRTRPIDDAELSAAAIRLRPILSPLDAALRAVLVRARRLVPLVLWRDDRGWYLVDTDGTVVLASGVALRDVLAAAPPALLIVPSHCADAATLEQLDYANLTFVTDAAPSRGEIVRSFSGATGRLYTNDTATPAGKLGALTAHLDRSLALVDELVGALAERPAVPRDPLTAFEATCMLAATSALADLGARLFPGEPTTPVLALSRFRNLDARVWFESDRLRVRVPLGRRHAELMRHGVLGELAVPWLSDQTIDLGGG